MVRNQRGMTLVEIMIVVVILGSLLAFLANRVFGARDKANYQQAKIQLQTLAEKLEMYYNDCGFYPEDDLGLQALTPQGEGSCPNWGPEAYLREVPKDPWNGEFIYERDGADYTLTCLAKGGRPGGSGYEKDIVYPEPLNE